MAKKRGGLGRGLSALIPTNLDSAEKTDTAISTSPVDKQPAAKNSSQKAAAKTSKTAVKAKKSSKPSAVNTKPVRKEEAAQAVAAEKAADKSAEKAVAQSAAQNLRPSDVFFSGGDDKRVKGGSARDLLSPRPKNARQNVSHETKGLVSVPGTQLLELPIADIVANKKQPRQVFDEDELLELANSIREVGVLQPVVVRQEQAEYELVMGERRLRAAKLAGLSHIPAIVRQVGSEDMLREALLENLHRVELNPLEEAAAYQQLMEDFGCTQAQLAQKVVRSRSQIANTIRLLRLPAVVQSKVAAGVISAGHARALLGLTDPAEQIHLAERIIAEGLSVRSTEEIVALGGARPKTKVKATTAAKSMLPAHYQQAADQWTDLLDTRVTIRPGKKTSKLVIDFVDEDDLARITQLISAAK